MPAGFVRRRRHCAATHLRASIMAPRCSLGLVAPSALTGPPDGREGASMLQTNHAPICRESMAMPRAVAPSITQPCPRRWGASLAPPGRWRMMRMPKGNTMAAAPNGRSCSGATRLKAPGEEYRRNVGIMLLNGDNKAFVAVRLNDPEKYWQMPQGGIDSGEESWVAAQRELYEETGVRDIELLAEVEDWIAYDFPQEFRARLYGGWEKYRGQAQKWFIIRLTGPEAQVDISGLGEEPEFSEWKWIDIRDLPTVVVPFKRDVYQEVVAEFQGMRLGYNRQV